MFRLAIVFGRGRTTNSKPACKSGRAGMERMRFTCSDKIEMPNLQVLALLANFLLDIQANRYATALDWVASPCARERGG